MVEKKPVAIAVLCVVTVLCLGLWLNSAQEFNRLEGKLWELEGDYEKLARVRTSLEENYSDLRTDKEDLQQEHDSLLEQYENLSVEYDDLLTELNDMPELFSSLIDALVLEREELIEEIAELRLELAACALEIDELNSQLDVLSEYTQTTSTRTITIDLIGTCTRVIDGDTFELSSGKIVRLADIDAPESYETGYYTSTNALISWIQGETVYLDIDDIYETDIYGRYVCVIYVEYGAGYANVNLALLTDGYAVSDDYPNEFDPSDWGTGNLDLSEASQDTTSSEPEPEPDPEPEPAWEYHSTYRGIEIQVYNPGATSYRAYFNGVWTSSTWLNILKLDIDEYLDPEPEAMYVGSINSNKYHYPSCYWAKQINPENEIWFTSKSDAESHGYVPCKVCKP